KTAKKVAPPPAWAWTLPAGLKAPEVPSDNPMSAAKVALGHKLFFDKRLSGDGSRSCYSCHQNELGNADGRALALGAGDKPLTRNTPTIWNVAYHTKLYWDGRGAGLEKQMLGAWKGGNMGVGADNLDAKAEEIGKLPEYRPAFTQIFKLGEADKVTPMQVAQIVSAYERTLLCGDSPYDTGKLGESAQRGWEVFRDKGCATCHTGDNFSDGEFHNVGIAVPKKAGEGDLGRGKVTKDAADNYKFRTPTLRNVSNTAPYFHDGSVATLEEAVRYMASGGNRKAPGLDDKLQDLKLTEDQIKDVVAFLESLACTGKLEVIGDQTVAGIGDRAPLPPPPT
ncbi:MAG: cytochrome-c peroxidase, partial [Nannocystaceae bacterium]